MQTLNYSFAASRPVTGNVHVGVVASGDLEVLIRPGAQDSAEVQVRTSADGFDAIWKRVLTRFFENDGPAGRYEINDFGATPGMVGLRLTQTAEYAREEQS